MAYGPCGANQWLLVPDHPSNWFTLQCNMHLGGLNLQLTFFSLFSKGKCCQADCLQVLQKYFMHILCHLGNPMLDSICDAKHLHQPTFKRKVLCFSYKIFNKETFERVLGGKTWCSFGQGHYLETTTKCLTCQRFQQKEALANARARKQDRRATSCSLLEIGPGEGLSVWEVELIWWPSLYSWCSEHGKLTFCFFGTKMSL